MKLVLIAIGLVSFEVCMYSSDKINKALQAVLIVYILVLKLELLFILLPY